MKNEYKVDLYELKRVYHLAIRYLERRIDDLKDIVNYYNDNLNRRKIDETDEAIEMVVEEQKRLITEYKIELRLLRMEYERQEKLIAQGKGQRISINYGIPL